MGELTEFGGRAVCPVDEYDDPTIRQEMVLHAVEEAFADAGRDPRPERGLLFRLLAEVHALSGPPLGRPIPFSEDGYSITLRASSDEHLGEPDSLVDLTATLVTA